MNGTKGTSSDHGHGEGCLDNGRARRNLAITCTEDTGLGRPWLDDADVTTCLQASDTILCIGPEAMPAVPELIALLSSSVAEVRLRAVDAIGSVAPADPRCARALENQRQDPDERVRIRAIQVLRRNN